MTATSEPKVLMIPMHPGMQYHFSRVGLPTYLLGNWEQFRYWRPRPANIIDLLPEYRPEQLSYGPAEYRRLLDALPGYPDGFDFAWLHFPWQMKLLWEDKSLPKAYLVAKSDELSEGAWGQLLDRGDIALSSFYPSTTQWVEARFGVRLREIELGLDPDDYQGWTGEAPRLLTVIHSWKSRGWRYSQYREACEGLAALHIDHLDRTQPPVGYEALRALYRSSRIYLHDGERDYTIALIEALMTGMPIVSFALPGIEAYVEHGVNGFVGRTAAEIRDYCRMLLDDFELARRMGAESRRKALARHDERRWRSDWRAVLGASA
jgi:hypothetical protein